MPALFKTIQGTVNSEMIGSVSVMKPIVGQLQKSDYIAVGSFKAYLQNLSKADEFKILDTPMVFGLGTNKTSFNIEISY